MRYISEIKMRRELEEQQVTSNRDYAFICPICQTVQSINSLVVAGTSPDQAEKMIGFSCEGILNDIGPIPNINDQSLKARKRRRQRGCDCALGGLFHVHELEITLDNGKSVPSFEVASREQAQTLALKVADAVAKIS